MNFPTRVPFDPVLGDVVRQALRDDLDVELTSDDGTLTIVIDDVPMTGIAWESFEYPLPGLDLHGEAAALADRLVAAKRRERFRSRMERLNTDDHAAAHGEQLPVEKDGGSV